MRAESQTKTPALRVRDLGVDAEDATLLRGVDLEVLPGEVLVVTGETGAGKTTLLDALSGMSPHRVTGTLEILGEDGLLSGTTARLRGGVLGVLRQDIRGWYTPYRRIGGQVLEGWRGVDRAEGRSRVEALLERFALPMGRVCNRYPNQLSDGMLRRIALAGLLARRPALVITDEPTAGLDGPTRWRAWELLRSSGAAVVAATHDLEMVAALQAVLRTVRISDGRLHPMEEA